MDIPGQNRGCADPGTHTFKVIKKSSVRLNLLQEVSKDNEILVTAQVELAVIGSNGSVIKLSKDLLGKI